MSEVVVTVTGRTMDELRRARDSVAEADLVELRLDGVERPDVRAALEGRLRPVIVTCRPLWEGGKFDGAESERRAILSEAVEAGAEYVDVEARAEFLPELIQARRGRGIVASHHLFKPIDTDLMPRFAELRATGAEIVKLAVEVDSLTETLPLFEIAAHAPRELGRNRGHVLVGMGRRGGHTRILAARLGNVWTYTGEGIAPGQMPPSKVLGEYRFRRIRPDADLYGVTGDPVGQSLSPAMHNAGFEQHGINAVYLALEGRDADDFVTFARAMGLRGGSVTAPFKVEMMRYVDQLDRVATDVGAVNTLVIRKGRWIGANTDVAGFLAPLKGRMALRGTRAAVLGAGGAARAVAVALNREGSAVTLHARQVQKAREVARLVGAKVAPLPPRPGTWDVLVNATPCGSRPGDPSPMAGVALDGEIVFDLIYTPPETPLMAQARQAGCWTIGGIEMLIAQAERQFELWTGTAPAPELFRAAVGAAASARTGVRA